MQDAESILNHYFTKRDEFGIKPGLERIHRLLELLGNPEKEIKAIHIAGTNGKGSTIQFMKNVLINNGYDVGVFTSPSFYGIRGHIEHNRSFIDNELFLHILELMKPAIKQLDDEENHPTTFEIITAVAFMYFKDHVDIVLVETGMGGREDTTNCFTPILSVITNVDFDHVGFLGDTLEEITAHKAGIIKPNVPIVTGEKKLIARNIIQKEAEALGSPLIEVTKDVDISHVHFTDHETTFTWTFNEEELLIKHHLRGIHQVDNCALALTALSLIKEQVPLNHDKLTQAIERTTIAGRLEKVHENPLIIIDGAHNKAGINHFIKSLEHMDNGKEKHLLIAIFKDKDVTEMLALIEKAFSIITVTTFDHPRAAKAEELYERLTHKENVTIKTWPEAIEHMLQEKDKQHYITGSLHFITRVREYILEKK